MIQLQSAGQPITANGIIELQNVILNNSKELKKDTGFFECYFKLLPKFKDTQSCFDYLNLMHHRKYNRFKYLSYKEFKKEWFK